MDKNQNNLSLENALRIAKLLKPLSPQARNELFRTKNEGDFSGFQKVAFENRLDASSIWTGIDDLWQQTSLGIEIPIDETPSRAQVNVTEGRGALGLAFTAGEALRLRRFSYKDFLKEANKHGDAAEKYWDEEEKKLQEDPKRKPSPGRTSTSLEARERAERGYKERYVASYRDGAQKWLEQNPSDHSLALALNKHRLEDKKLTHAQVSDIANRHVEIALRDWDERTPDRRYADRTTTAIRAHNEIYDQLLLTSPKSAEKWANEYNDPELQAAIERKRQRDEAQAIENQGRVSKMLGRNPAAKFAPAPGTPSPQTSPIRPQLTVLNPTFKIDQNKPAPDQTATENPEDDQNSTSAPKKQGIRSKLNHYSPSQIRARAISRAKNRIINSKIGQKFQKSRIGRLSSKLNQFKGKASRATRKIKNLLNPLNYLLNLLKKSIIGSLISAISSVVTTVASLAVTITVGIVTGAIGMFSAAVGLVIATVGLPGFIVILIVALLFVVFALTAPCVIFCDQETRTFIDSPYPGIGYSITAPETIQNEENITYSIFILFDEAKATSSIDDLTVYTKIPPGTSFVSATGNYNLSGSDISWKLYPENKTSDFDNQIIHTFTFTLTVDPVDDIVVSNTLSLNASSSNSPPPLPGNTAYNEETCNGKYRYIKDNDLLPYNFGDPECTLDTFAKRDSLYRLLKQKDPKWADFWFNVIIPGESGYRPNAWYLCGSNPWSADDPRCTPNPRGAWGLFQMGSSRPPGSSQNRIGGRGDVTWQEQVDNAVQRNKGNELLGLLFRYWQVAIEWCRDGNMSKPQCKDM